MATKMKLWNMFPYGITVEWDEWFNKVFGFIIRAETEEDARKIADENSGAENGYGTRPWLDASKTVCIELTAIRFRISI